MTATCAVNLLAEESQSLSVRFLTFGVVTPSRIATADSHYQSACPLALKKWVVDSFFVTVYAAASEITRLTLFDPPQLDRIDGGNSRTVEYRISTSA